MCFLLYRQLCELPTQMIDCFLIIQPTPAPSNPPTPAPTNAVTNNPTPEPTNAVTTANPTPEPTNAVTTADPTPNVSYILAG